MSREKNIRKLNAGRMLVEEPFTGVPLIEITGRNRVLIEHHQGVSGYGSTEIRIKTRYGCVCVCGECLQLIMMSREKLVITGKIHSVNLQGRG